MVDKRGTIRSYPSRQFSKKSLETLDKRIDELEDNKADLVNGKVPESQLPSYVDDVINGYLHDGKFYEEDTYQTEITAEEGKIYVDLATNLTYRWSGLAYIQVGGVTVEANPTLVGTEPELTGLQIGNAKYKIKTVEANPTLLGTEDYLTGLQVGDTKYKVPQDVIVIDVVSALVTSIDSETLAKLKANPEKFIFKTFTGAEQLEDGSNVYCYFTKTGASNYSPYVYRSLALTSLSGGRFMCEIVVNSGTGELTKSDVSLGVAFKSKAASNWVSDSTITGFDYKCVLSCEGITEDSVVYVKFGDTEAASGNYSSIVETGTNKVTIWSKVNTSITIPLIKEI